MSSRYYPLYQKGNPQLRVFLPNFWMKLIRSEEPLPSNKVLFQTSIEMTEFDVKNYLEKIYKVPVVEVKTEIKMGTIRRAYGRKNLVKEDDYKEALVTLPKDHKFEFPDIEVHKALKEEEDFYKTVKNADKKQLPQPKNLSTNIPKWFSY